MQIFFGFFQNLSIVNSLNSLPLDRHDIIKDEHE